MFTMSLGGSQVRLETGNQVNTKIRQKPLEFSNQFRNFVKFEKDRIVVTIDAFQNFLNEIGPNADLSMEDWQPVLDNLLYIVMYVRCKRSAKKYWTSGAKTLAKRLKHTKYWYGDPTCHYAWKPILAQQIKHDKSVYDFGIDAFKDWVLPEYDVTLDRAWLKRQIKYWRQGKEASQEPKHLRKKYPIFVKVRFGIIFNNSFLNGSKRLNELIHDKGYLENVQPISHYDGSCSLMPQSYTTLWRSKEKYLTL